MVKRFIMLTLLFMMVFVPSASALIYEDFVHPTGMCYKDSNSMYVVDCDSGYTSWELIQLGTDGSQSTKIINMPKLDDVAVDADGDVYLMFYSGDIYKVELSGTRDWDDINRPYWATLLAQDGVNPKGTAPTVTRREILIDQDEDLLFIHWYQLYLATSPTYSSSVWNTYGSFITDVDYHPTHGIITVESGNTDGIWIKYSIDGAPEVQIYTSGTVYDRSLSVAANGDLYAFMDSSLYRFNVSNSWQKTTISQASSSIRDSVIMPSGIIYATDETSGYVRTYNTVDSIGGFNLLGSDDEGGDTIDLITWDNTSYTTGDTAALNVNISNTKWDTANYTYYLNIYDHAGLKDTQTLSEQYSTKTYTFEPTQIASSFIGQSRRQHTDGTVEILTSALASFSQTGASYAVTFDKEVYATSDTITMLYSDAPSDTALYLQGWDDDAQQYVYENTWTVSGSGSESLTVPNPNAESYTVRIIYDGYVLDSDYSEISAATESHLYGVVYNAATGARMEGAEVAIDDTYKLTDEIGSYSWVVDTGEHNISCAEDGFQTISYDDYMISGDKEINFYLSPNAVGDSVYVMVKDYETKAPIQYAHVIISNDTWSMGDYSSNTGLVELAAPEGTYTLKVVKDGYDNIEKTIDTSASSFFDVLMASGSYNPNAPGAGGLAEDESLTDYYNARFREFAPTAWGFFLLVIVLYLLSILTSFGGSKSRR